jgi:copper chaperone CopZ
MTKTFKLEGLDCPVCAAKMEKGIIKIKGVEDASVSFMTQKMVISAPDEIFDEVYNEAVKACRKVEPDLIIK